MERVKGLKVAIRGVHDDDEGANSGTDNNAGDEN
jgi:hypothetical protein